MIDVAELAVNMPPYLKSPQREKQALDCKAIPRKKHFLYPDRVWVDGVDPSNFVDFYPLLHLPFDGDNRVIWSAVLRLKHKRHIVKKAPTFTCRPRKLWPGEEIEKRKPFENDGAFVITEETLGGFNHSGRSGVPNGSSPSLSVF